MVTGGDTYQPPPPEPNRRPTIPEYDPDLIGTLGDEDNIVDRLMWYGLVGMGVALGSALVILLAPLWIPICGFGWLCLKVGEWYKRRAV
jgi:hypothetical protein